MSKISERLTRRFQVFSKPSFHARLLASRTLPELEDWIKAFEAAPGMSDKVRRRLRRTAEMMTRKLAGLSVQEPKESAAP